MSGPVAAQSAWVSPTTRARAKLRAVTHHPQAWASRLLRRQRGVAATVEVPQGAAEILKRLNALPITTWTYGYDHDSVRHLGPMAQDFAAAFGLGDSDRRIDMVDANGVVMVAIQALSRRVEELEQQLDALRAPGPTRADRDSPPPATD